MMVDQVPFWPNAAPINISTIGSMPAVAVLKDGRFITVWKLGNIIQAQLYDAAGAKVVGGTVTVSGPLDGLQRDPAVSALDNGGFVISWETSTQTAGSAVKFAVFGGDNDENGVPKPPIKSSEVSLANFQNDHANSSIKALPGGGFAISVTGASVAGTPLSPNDAVSYIYDAQGNWERATSFTSTGRTFDTDITVVQNGSQTAYVTVASVERSGTEPHKVICEIRSTTTDQPVKPAFAVATPDTSTAVSVTTLNNGRFVVAWSDGNSIKAKVFNADGSGETQAIVLHRSSTSNASIPAITIEAVGKGFALAFEEPSSDNSSSELYVKTFDLEGNETGAATKPYSSGGGYHGFPSISSFRDGRFLVNWSEGSGVHARIFDPRKEVVNITGTDANDSLWGTNFTDPDVTKARDTLDGGTGNDVLNGLAGNDVLIGSAGGNDIFNGGEGTDWVVYSGASKGVKAYLSRPDFNDSDDESGIARGDTYNSIENLDGTDFDDILEGTNDETGNRLWGAGADDRLIGLGGDDTLIGEAGNDTLLGGEGKDSLDGEGGDSDWASYEDAKLHGVSVDLEKGEGYSGDAQGDTLKGIENLIGSHLDDVLRGDGAANTIRGGAGNDVIEGRGGADSLDGGGGFDFVDFYHSTVGVVASLADSGTNNGGAKGDVYSGIEALAGSAFNDVLTGDGHANELRGWRGNDTLDGRGGSDVVKLNGTLADYSVTLNQDGSVTITDKRLDSADNQGSDTIRNVEVFQFDNNVRLSLAGLAAGAQRLLTSDVVDENTATGINITGFLASAKTGGPLNYALVNDAEGRFTLDAATGMLKVANGVKLDYEQASQHTITVRVTDASGASTDKAVTILVQDVMHEVAVGSTGADVMKGGAGQDRFTSLSGNDQIDAGFGNDTLIGGAGKDALTGGKGKDIFVFETKANKKTNLDKINDFSVKDDGIWLENKVFAKLGKKGTEKKPMKLAKDFFTVGDKAKDADDYLIYNKKKGVLLYDVDGSGSKKAVEIATLKKNLKMTEKDFFVI